MYRYVSVEHEKWKSRRIEVFGEYEDCKMVIGKGIFSVVEVEFFEQRDTSVY